MFSVHFNLKWYLLFFLDLIARTIYVTVALLEPIHSTLSLFCCCYLVVRCFIRNPRYVWLITTSTLSEQQYIRVSNHTHDKDFLNSLSLSVLIFHRFINSLFFPLFLWKLISVRKETGSFFQICENSTMNDITCLY